MIPDLFRRLPKIALHDHLLVNGTAGALIDAGTKTAWRQRMTIESDALLLEATP